MMRGAAILALAAMPALAQDGPRVEVGYDDGFLSACLDRAAGDKGAGATADDLRICIGTAAQDCMARPGGDTTVGMSGCLGRETGEWDMLLNAWYDRALAQAEAADAELDRLGSAAAPAAPVLRDAHRHWIAFRDASCTFESVRWQGGTAGGPASMQCMLELTAEQALRLRAVVETP